MEMIEKPHTDLEMIGVSLERRLVLRLLLMAPLLSAFGTFAAEASPINPSETLVLQPAQIHSAGRSRKAVLAAGLVDPSGRRMTGA